MNATLKLPIMSENQLKYLKEARDKLSKAGVTFDTEYDLKEGIFDWEFDWSLENAELLENKTLQFNVYTDEKVKHIMNAKNKLKKASVFFDSKLDDEDRIVWELNEIRGAELVIRKTRKGHSKSVKVVKPNLKVPYNIYRKTKYEEGDESG